MAHTGNPNEHDMDAIYDTLSMYLEKDDLAGAEAYVVQNINLFPEEARSEIVGILIGEALAKTAALASGTAKLQDQALIGIEELEKLQEELKKKGGA